MASVKFILRTQQQDKEGKCPLYIRLIQDRQSKFISTGLKIHPAQWDDENKKVRKSFPNSARTNAMLAAKLAEASATIADSERKSKSITARKLKEAIKGKDRIKFFAYAESKLKKLQHTYSPSTYKIYKSQLAKFKAFVNDDSIMFDDITVSLLKDYMLYAGNVLKNNKTSQKLSMIVLSMMFKHAQEEEIIDDSFYPFKKLKLETEPSKRNFLNDEQFEKLKNHRFEGRSKAELYRDLFMFSVSAGGLRFSDVVTLTVYEYDSETHMIRKEVEKTGRVHHFKIGETAQKIIKKYRNHPDNLGEFLFPSITEKNYFSIDAEGRRRAVSNQNGLCNLYLRKLGKELEFPFTLHFHLSRHTFATMALNKGMRIEHVSKLLDHRDISTTQIYAKIVNEELSKAVEQFVI